jgi:protein TonB
MFDLIQGTVDRPFHEGKPAPAAVSIFVHVTVLGFVFAVPFLYVTNQLPEVPAVMAFVAGAEAPIPAPPPPPPPPAPAAKPMQAPASTKSIATSSPSVAPLQAPAEITSEPPATEVTTDSEGGVEGGVIGGVAGGVVSGLVTSVPAPPPPPPQPPSAGPVRIGGQIKAPALLHRVEPVYPDVAVLAKVTGVVILEATVDIDGAVTSVRVLQSRGVLDRAAIGAVKQWQYSPLVLNGIPTSFVLTVTLNFALARS